MNSLIRLHVSKKIKPPYSLRFCDRFSIINLIEDKFIRLNHAIILQDKNKLGTSIIANNGDVVFPGRTIKDTLKCLLSCDTEDTIELKGNYFCLINWAWADYFHFTKNAFQSILVALENKINLEEYKIIINEDSPDYVYEYLNLLKKANYKIDFIEIPKNKIILCENMIFPIPQNGFTTYHANLFKNFRDNLICKQKEKKELPKKIYISRNDSGNRRLVANEEECLQELKKLGYTSLELAKYSVKEKIEIFSEVEEIVLPHGAGGCHIVYCNSNVRVFDVMMENDCLPFFPQIVNAVNSFYFGIVCKTTPTQKQEIDIPLLLNVITKEKNKIYKNPEYKYTFEEYEITNNTVLTIINTAIEQIKEKDFGSKLFMSVYEKNEKKIKEFLNKKISIQTNVELENWMLFYDMASKYYKEKNDTASELLALEKYLNTTRGRLNKVLFDRFLALLFKEKNIAKINTYINKYKKTISQEELEQIRKKYEKPMSAKIKEYFKIKNIKKRES